MPCAPPLRAPAERSHISTWNDWPSYAFLLAVAANVILIVHTSDNYLRIPLVVIQSILLVGCQEIKHLCVHRTFLSPRWANDMVGFVCAALFGVNFFGYRQFHFAHHRHTCTAHDPEGQLYALSWRTKWVWLLAPFEVVWVAHQLNRQGWACTPASFRKLHYLGLIGLSLFLIGMGVLAWRFPMEFLWAFVIPMVLFSWIDFLLTQGEHYGVAITAPNVRRSSDDITHNVVLPRLVSWMTLHRSLHRVHHRHPAMRWFHARQHLDEEENPPLTYHAFAKHWLRKGPRLWQ